MKYDVQKYMQLDKFIDMKIHTPEDLLAWMNCNISYGFVDVHGKKYTDFDGETFYNLFKLQSPKQFFENKLGVCWDNVEFVRYVFSRLGITHDTVYLKKDNIEQSTHTFVLYKEKMIKYIILKMLSTNIEVYTDHLTKLKMLFLQSMLKLTTIFNLNINIRIDS